jgi:pullulanase
MMALRNSFPDELNPNAGISYLDIHDNWALADQFATRDWDGRLGVDEGPFKVAAVLLFTGLGPIVLHGGTEIMRSKGLSPLEEKIIPTASGPIYFHGKRDTYNLRAANRYEWHTVGAGPGEVDGPGSTKRPNDYAGMLAYWKGLIALRRSEAGAVFRQGEPVSEDHYRFLTPPNPHLLGYVVGDRVLVLINTDEHAATFAHVSLPVGHWRLVADAARVDLSGLRGKDARLSGTQSYNLRLPPQSARIWVRE